jgi:tetratricopeptide (TPR) repeat protein
LAVATLGLLSSTQALAQPREPGPDDTARDDAADADKAQRARELMREGLAEWGKGNLEGARDALMKAWEVSPNPNIVSALAEIDMKLGRYREAADYWEVYLVRYPPDYDTAQGKLDECRRNLGKLRIHVDPPDAVVSLDDEVITRTRLNADVWVEPGTHTLHAEIAGNAATQHVAILAGDSNDVSLVVPGSKRATPAAQPSSGTVAPPPRAVDDSAGSGVSAKTVVLISGAVLTVAATTMGAVYTVKANRASDEAAHYDALARSKVDPAVASQDSFCAPPPGMRPAECTDLENAVNERQRATNLAIGSYIAASAFAAGTVATYFLWPEAERKAAAKRGVSVGPMVGGRGVQVRVVF